MGDPTLAPTDVFAVMNSLARDVGAVNLGHGFADGPPLPVLAEAAHAAVVAGDNQYSPSHGLDELRDVLSMRARRRGLSYGAEDEITVTNGCTEALAATILGFAPAGSEVVTLDPFYDSYADIVSLAGAQLVGVPIDGLGTRRVDVDLGALERAITPRTRVLLLNAPHNPSGLVLDASQLAVVAGLAIAHDLVVVSDEVYEDLSFEKPHETIASIAAMRERTVVCGSATKTLSVSGWRVGWALAPAAISAKLRDVHRALSFCAPSPLQAGVAAALQWAEDTGYFDALRRDYQSRRDLLVEGLRTAGLDVTPPPAGYFVVADVSAWSRGEDIEDFAIRLAHEAGVVGLPLTTCTSSRASVQHVLRFAFCKQPAVLEEAVRRLAAFAARR